MSGTTEKIKNSVDTNDEIEYKIEIATQTLERNISFISNCDNKPSIVLASIGVLLTIILTNEGLNEFFRIIIGCFSEKTFCSIFYLICVAVSAFAMVFGLYELGCVLVARTAESAKGQQHASNIFFTGISKNSDYVTYKTKYLNMSHEDLLDDLVAQIFINADIATQKYKKYNIGLKFTIIGFVVFVCLLVIGSRLY